MSEVNLLSSLPRGSRNLSARSIAKSKEVIRISSEYGAMYFDGPREYGYGGYYYDGRWKSVAVDIIKHFSLKKGDRILDVGCAKGFLVKELVALGMDAYGLDISSYALMNCEPEVVGRLHHGTAQQLPFPDGSFSAVLAINTLHNLKRDQCKVAISEIERLAPGKGFVQVDSFLTHEQKVVFESWVLTAQFYDYPQGWKLLFDEAGYTGDYFWTIIE